MRTFLVLLCLSVPCSAQAQQTQLPPLDPTVQLGVCQQQRARFLSDSEQASTYATQFLAEIADLKKKLAEAEELNSKYFRWDSPPEKLPKDTP